MHKINIWMSLALVFGGCSLAGSDALLNGEEELEEEVFTLTGAFAGAKTYSMNECDETLQDTVDVDFYLVMRDNEELFWVQAGDTTPDLAPAESIAQEFQFTKLEVESVDADCEIEDKLKVNGEILESGRIEASGEGEYGPAEGATCVDVTPCRYEVAFSLEHLSADQDETVDFTGNYAVTSTVQDSEDGNLEAGDKTEVSWDVRLEESGGEDSRKTMTVSAIASDGESATIVAETESLSWIAKANSFLERYELAESEVEDACIMNGVGYRSGTLAGGKLVGEIYEQREYVGEGCSNLVKGKRNVRFAYEGLKQN